MLHGKGLPLGTAILGLLLTLAPGLSGAAELPAGSGSRSIEAVDSPDASPSGAASRIATPSTAASAAAAYAYAWPVERRLFDGLLLINYVDDDASSGMRDYESAPHTYDGHAGTDISLYHFRAMDRGVAVTAARAGRVVTVDDGNYDRNTSMNGMTANRIIVEDDLGVRVHYAHLRTYSATVTAGESVQAGDVLGYIGSSGSSSIPHLHVEFRGAASVLLDPWSGPANPVPSLWSAQEPYVGFNPLRLFDIGLFTQASAGGSVTDIPLATLEQRLSEPARFGSGEPVLGVWFLYQCQPGEGYRAEILRPDGSLFAFAEGTQSQKQRLAYQYYWWTWSGRVPQSAYGTWTARVLSGGVVQATRSFQVGAATSFGPRFWPVAGRSLRVAGAEVQDALSVSSLGGPVTYRLLNAPSFVQLVNGSTVRIPSTASLSQRTATFQVIATDGAGLTDTMWYHLVDPRASRTVTAVPGEPQAPASPGAGFALAPVSPNPFIVSTGASGRPSARVSYVLPARDRVRIDVVDVRGRRVRTLIDGAMDAGPGSVTWDAKDDRGAPVPSGVYFVKAALAGRTLARKLVLAR